MKKSSDVLKVLFRINLWLFFLLCLVFPTVVAAGPQAGDVIDASNVDQYKDYLPNFMVQYAKHGWEMMTPVKIYVADPSENLPPKSFREVTRQNAGKTKLNDDGTLSGYISGVPFPNPKEPNKALKIMWNFAHRWRGDDFAYPTGYMVSQKRKGGSITYSAANISQIKFCHRTNIDPKPSLDNPKNLFFAQLYISMTPPNKDMATLTWRYDIEKDDEMWAYVPTLRRTLRLVSSERSNPVRGTPYTWDDFYGFDGQTTKFKYTLVAEKPVLAIMNQKTMAVPGTKYERGYDQPILAGPSDPFELRNTYVIDAVSTNPRYPETKKTLFITADAYGCVYSEVFDRNGKLWKGQTFNFTKVKTKQGEYGPWGTGSSMSEFKTQYWTYALLNNLDIDSGLDQYVFSPEPLALFREVY